MEYEAEGSRPTGRPKRTWKEVVQKDCQWHNLNRENAMDHCRWKKLINIGWWSGWWVGECFFWYRLNWVVPDKGPQNGCCCCYCCRSDNLELHSSPPLVFLVEPRSIHSWFCRHHERLQQTLDRTSSCGAGNPGPPAMKKETGWTASRAWERVILRLVWDSQGTVRSPVVHTGTRLISQVAASDPHWSLDQHDWDLVSSGVEVHLPWRSDCLQRHKINLLRWTISGQNDCTSELLS